jgi:thioredoxin reductase (NADPH)
MNEKKIIRNKIIILGSGPAGYTAAIYACRANLKPILITGITPGGQLTTTNEIENWPGDSNKLSGLELMNRMDRHAKKFNTKVIFDVIQKVEFNNRPFILFGEENKYITDSVIIATGAYAKYLGLDAEKKYLGKGVSSCATCDGMLYKNKEVAVIGGGNTAIEESLYLSNIASKIHLIHRKNTFKAEKILIHRLNKKILSKKIIFYSNSTLKNIFGNKDCINEIQIQNQNKKYLNIKISGLFIAIGHNPNTEIFNSQIKMKNGYIEIQKILQNNSTQTNIPGVFAAGDAVDSHYRQAITAAATGCMAALDAAKYLENII